MISCSKFGCVSEYITMPSDSKEIGKLAHEVTEKKDVDKKELKKLLLLEYIANSASANRNSCRTFCMLMGETIFEWADQELPLKLLDVSTETLIRTTSNVVVFNRFLWNPYSPDSLCWFLIYTHCKTAARENTCDSCRQIAPLVKFSARNDCLQFLQVTSGSLPALARNSLEASIARAGVPLFRPRVASLYAVLINVTKVTNCCLWSEW